MYFLIFQAHDIDVIPHRLLLSRRLFGANVLRPDALNVVKSSFAGQKNDSFS